MAWSHKYMVSSHEAGTGKQDISVHPLNLACDINSLHGVGIVRYAPVNTLARSIIQSSSTRAPTGE